MGYVAIYFIGSVFVIPAIHTYMRIFFGYKRTPSRVRTLSYWAYPVALTVSFVLSLPPVAGAVIAFLSAFFISINYEAPWTKRVVASVSITAIGLMIYYAIAIVLGIELVSAFAPFAEYRSTDTLFLMEMVLFPVLTLLVALLLQNFTNIRKNVIVLPIFWVSVFVIPLSSIIVLFIVVYAEGLSLFSKITVLFILVGINVLVFYLHNTLSSAYEARLKLELHAQERKYYLSQCQLMQEMAEQTKSARHDMISHFAVLKGLADEINAGKIIEHLDGLLTDAGKVKAYSDTGNVAFDSIINFKLRNAKRDNIKPNIRLCIPSSLNIETTDIAAILGNLLDNALDAVAQVEERTVKLDIEYGRKALFILVENSFDGVVEYVQEGGAREKRLVTRKSGGDHGQGFRNIRRAMEKYDGYMDIAYEGNVFSVTVLLYVNGDGKDSLSA